MAAGRGILVAKSSAQLLFDGSRVNIRKGVTTVREGHPLLRGREHMFEPITVTYDVPIEAAAARPKARSRR